MRQSHLYDNVSNKYVIHIKKNTVSYANSIRVIQRKTRDHKNGWPTPCTDTVFKESLLAVSG